MMNQPATSNNIYSLGYQIGKFISKSESHYQPRSLQEIVDDLINFPIWYKDWWLSLYKNDPVHVFVETTLLAAIVYFLVINRRRSKPKVNKLTDKEQNELLKEWKDQTRKPLAPVEASALPDPSIESSIIVHKSNGRFVHVEDTSDGKCEIKQVLNFGAFDFLGMQSDTIPKNEDLIESSQKLSSDGRISPTSAVEVPGNAVHPVKQASLDALDRYGCGSCGPRGFYGTVDVHLELEKQVSNFMKTEDSILYSDGASTVTSTIAAFCKRGDLIVVDEAVYEPIRTGINLSRANVKWYAHNDMDDLKRVLEEVQEADRKLGRKLNEQRRFIIAEGLYKNTGNICPLDELVELKHEFKYRLILDESFSFGTLGANGRGVMELYNKKIMHDAEIVILSMENSVGSVGALTIGSEEVVDHQRLSGSGYCFSASSPPFTASAAMAAINLLQSKPELTLHRLHKNQEYLYSKMQALLETKFGNILQITSDARSPILLLQVGEQPETMYLNEVVFLQEVAKECMSRGVALVATGASNEPQRATDAPPGIRITVSASHTQKDLDMVLNTLKETVDIIMSRFHEDKIKAAA